MYYYHMADGTPAPGSVPEKQPNNPPEQPTQPGPEVTPPPSPSGPDREQVPNEVPEHDITRRPPDPKSVKSGLQVREEDVMARAEEAQQHAAEAVNRAQAIVEQDREDVQERSPDLFPDKTLETGDSYDQQDSKTVPEE